MKFKLGEKVKAGGCEGTVIAIFYHHVQVSLGRSLGVWIFKKKEVEKL